MIVTLLLALALGPGAAPPPRSPAARLEAVRTRYRQLAAEVDRAHAAGETRADLEFHFSSAAQDIDREAASGDLAGLADVERNAELDAQLVPLLLRGASAPLSTAPGAHVGLTHAGNAVVPFAYWIPAGYDGRRPASLVVLLHGAGQPETNVLARGFLRQLADASGTVVVSPGGDDSTTDTMAAALTAAGAAVSGVARIDPRRIYWGGISRGVYGAFHAVAREAQAPAGFLAINGVLDEADTAAVGRKLRGRGVYEVIGSRDEAFGTEAVRADVRRLRAAGVRARYYEVPGGVHGFAPNAPGIVRAWHDMLGGVVTVPDDGLGR